MREIECSLLGEDFKGKARHSEDGRMAGIISREQFHRGSVIGNVDVPNMPAIEDSMLLDSHPPDN